VIRVPSSDRELQIAKAQLDQSQCVQALAREQRADGGWGRFHSQDTRRKQAILTTEMGIERALALGLDSSHPILTRASTHILNILQGRAAFPDPPEKNQRWPTGTRLFLAGTLAQIAPDHPAIHDDKVLWGTIAARAFQSGQYNEEDEAKAHVELTGIPVRGTYLVFRNKYQFNLLGTLRGKLAGNLEQALLQWLWQHPNGIGYLSVPLNHKPPQKPGPFDRWLASLELLARVFPSWTSCAGAFIRWLLDRRDEQGFWDFGPRAATSSWLPLSDGWRDKRTRQLDWTTRALVLLRSYCDNA
jgi:hypothetical protein